MSDGPKFGGFRRFTPRRFGETICWMEFCRSEEAPSREVRAPVTWISFFGVWCFSRWENWEPPLTQTKMGKATKKTCAKPESNRKLKTCSWFLAFKVKLVSKIGRWCLWRTLHVELGESFKGVMAVITRKIRYQCFVMFCSCPLFKERKKQRDHSGGCLENFRACRMAPFWSMEWINSMGIHISCMSKISQTRYIPYPDAPWDWYIYLHST